MENTFEKNRFVSEQPPFIPNKNYWKITTVILSVIVVFCGIALLSLMMKKPEREKSGALEARVSTPASSPTMPDTMSQTDPSMNWKAYTHTNGVFTFKYPSDVQLTSNPDKVSLLKDPGQPQIDGFLNGVNIEFSLIPLQAHGVQTLEKYVDNEIMSLKMSPNEELTQSKQKITVNGYTGFTYTTSFEGASRYIYLQSPFQSGTIISIVDSTQDPKHQGYEKIAHQILSTFQFTPAKQSAYTCTNKNLHISVTLPDGSWSCIQTTYGTTTEITSDTLSFTLTSLGRGAYCEYYVTHQIRPDSCVATPFFKNDLTDTMLYHVDGEDKEIFGSLGSNASLSVTHIDHSNKTFSETEIAKIKTVLSSLSKN